MIEAKLANIDIDSIDFGKRFREATDVEELKADILKHQLIQPIAVRDNNDGTYLLLAGGRRITACKQLGHLKISAHVYDSNIDEFDVRCIELAENIHRKDMTFSERASLTLEIHRLHEQKYGKALKSSPGQSMADTAKLVNKSAETVRQDIELAKAIEVMPSVAQAKNRTEALRIWNKEKLNVLHKELSERLEHRKVSTDKDERLKAVANSFVICDFLEYVKTIPDKSVHICEVDPPYGIDLLKNKSQIGKGTTLDCYNEIPAEKYIDFMTKVIKECYRILNVNGWMLMWFAPEPWFEPMYRAILSAGFELKRMPAIWAKTGGAFQTNWPEFELANSYELMFYARKGLATLNRAGRCNSFHYGQVPPHKKIHPTERPVEMMEDILSTFVVPGSRLVVPFAGSGNTLLAAANLGMPAVGCDLEESYKNTFTVRVYESEPGKYKSLEN